MPMGTSTTYYCVLASALFPVMVEGKFSWDKNGGLAVKLVAISIVFAVFIVLGIVWNIFFKSPWYVLPCKKQNTKKSFTPESWPFDDIVQWAYAWRPGKSPRKTACMAHKNNFCEVCHEDYTIMNVLGKDATYLESRDVQYRLGIVQTLMMECYNDSNRTNRRQDTSTLIKRCDDSLHNAIYRLLKETEDPVVIVHGFASVCYRLLKSPATTIDNPVFLLADKATQELLHIRESPEAVEQSRQLYGWSSSADTENARKPIKPISMAARDDYGGHDPTDDPTDAWVEHEA